MLPKRDVIQLLSHATVFACPSIYEPLGIVNLEAMACEAAVVASATGGIVEVVRDGETGYLVELEQAPGSIDPVDPHAFAAAFAERVNRLIADPGAGRGDGASRAPARDRVVQLAGDRRRDRRRLRGGRGLSSAGGRRGVRIAHRRGGAQAGAAAPASRRRSGSPRH